MVDVTIREGDIFLLPPHVPHSPQRFAEHGRARDRASAPARRAGRASLWYCESCHRQLYAEYFELTNIETQLPPVFERFFGSLEHSHLQALRRRPRAAAKPAGR